MGHADCIGQNGRETGYIFAMRFRGPNLPLLWMLALASATALRADTGDVEGSRDYAGFQRPPGFVITDYDEDNPAQFDFPVARPLPIDANYVEKVHAMGHRYVIRYELAAGRQAPALFQTQQYYEKLAAGGGFKIEKSGAVGDVTETFHLLNASREVWVYLVPAVTANVLTVVETIRNAPPAPPRPVATTTAPPPVPALAMPTPPAPPTTPTVQATPTPPPRVVLDEDALYAALNENGRAVVPFVFPPGKDDLDETAQPLIDHIAAMMRKHPDIFIRIEGHTDNSGDPEDNMRLSAQRAIAVQTRLIAAHIDKKRLDAVGVGGLQPVADNITAEGREKNRRIELVLWKSYPGFHTTAPNGQNYYPATGASSAPTRTGL
jgi:outer membrane protein OmpA-like peptidoglycan-associated protein